IDTQGGMSVKKIFPDAILIGILPPSAKEQEKRLNKWGVVNDEEINRRLEAAKEERKTLLKYYNYRVINKEIKETVEKIKKFIEKLLEKGVKK
ncbi:MAG: guanylate kinase, partial [Thermoplasmata archaeon]